MYPIRSCTCWGSALTSIPSTSNSPRSTGSNPAASRMQRRLARAVGPDEGGQRAAVDLERDIVQREHGFSIIANECLADATPAQSHRFIYTIHVEAISDCFALGLCFDAHFRPGAKRLLAFPGAARPRDLLRTHGPHKRDWCEALRSAPISV